MVIDSVVVECVVEDYEYLMVGGIVVILRNFEVGFGDVEVF